MKVRAAILAFISLGWPSLLYADTPSPSFPGSTTAEAAAISLRGMEYSANMIGEKIPTSLMNCTYQGTAILHLDGVTYEDWTEDHAYCQGRIVILLTRKTGSGKEAARRRVIDTLLLPEVASSRSRKRPKDLLLYRSLDGGCTLHGRPDTMFIALLNWANRDRISWREGVKKAWTFDIENGRIVSIPPRRVTCEWTDP